MKRFFRFLIKAYSYMISPLIGQNCRYEPTCSGYADKAIEKHGVLKGLFLTTRRICRCHPWSKCSHYDPVPDQFMWRVWRFGNAAEHKKNIKQF